jgi:hypothetical protein
LVLSTTFTIVYDTQDWKYNIKSTETINTILSERSKITYALMASAK